MSQSAARELNEFPNLIELIDRQSGLHDSETWWGPAVGIDEVADGIPARAIGSDELGAIALGCDEQFGPSFAIGSDEVNIDPLPATQENFLQDEIQQRPLEVIGQDETTPAVDLKATSICADETIGQDENPGIPAMTMTATSICADETIGQDEAPDTPAVELATISICNVENVLQDETVSDSRLKTGIAQVGTTVYGLPLYNFRYIGKPEVYEGVMAQDVLKVMPSAVLRGADGYYRVKYKDLGVQMRRVA
ncbi:MAG TPA: tail fiber domain-containing protein [Aestuariivirga sp.]|nr:tail fiber domain-containing protein [Aestuariivirga sp.]